ncbi:sensor histidine kinase [Clostridium neuense]|uniref:histidine kinase n=1 Tax=Clostridium neuense TaxID=1728934 RepID=A0ABW8TKN4_9CLOT
MRFSIRYKILFGFSLIFLSGFLVLGMILSSSIEKNNENLISQNFNANKLYFDEYINEFILLHDRSSLQNISYKECSDFGMKLHTKDNSRILLYSYKGKLIYDSDSFHEKILDKDLKQAENNKNAYTINKINGKTIVSFSYPIILDNKIYGIFRYTKDYTDIFSYSSNLIDKLMYSLAAIFAVVFIFSIFLSRSISVPVLKLSRLTSEMAEGNYNTEALNIKTKDEIGVLARNFILMKEKIQKQIETIKQDRDNLMKLEEHRKVFFDSATHELRTPLTVILGYAQMIKENGFTDKDFFLKGMGHIEKESKRLYDMVVDLLEISKLKSDTNEMKFSEVNLKKMLENTCEEMSIKASKYEVKIVFESDDDIEVMGDENSLKQVFINIIDNSIKYGAVKSTISLKLERENNSALVIINNRGDCIPRDKMDKIFEPFYRVEKKASREKGGSGLGLYIVKDILDKHNGEISMENVEDEGVRTKIKLPIHMFTK